MAHALIYLALQILSFIAMSFALAFTLIVIGMLAAAFVGLIMTRSPVVKSTIELLVVVSGIAIAAYVMPAQALVAGLFCWIYLELLRVELIKQRKLAAQQADVTQPA